MLANIWDFRINVAGNHLCSVGANNLWLRDAWRSRKMCSQRKLMQGASRGRGFYKELGRKMSGPKAGWAPGLLLYSKALGPPHSNGNGLRPHHLTLGVLGSSRGPRPSPAYRLREYRPRPSVSYPASFPYSCPAQLGPPVSRLRTSKCQAM